MQQLTGADYGSIFMERGNTFSHVAALVIYDPSSAPGGKVRFKDILAHFDRRLHRHPIFRRRLMVATKIGRFRTLGIQMSQRPRLQPRRERSIAFEAMTRLVIPP